MLPISDSAEWLEADALGGFASGTTSGVRTRRYHALLLTATKPPSARTVLVNGLDAWIETPHGNYFLSSQRYVPDIISPDGTTHLTEFQLRPWPKFHFTLRDDLKADAKAMTRQQFFTPLQEHLNQAGLGHVSEIAEAEPHFTPSAARSELGLLENCSVWIE